MRTKNTGRNRRSGKKTKKDILKGGEKPTLASTVSSHFPLFDELDFSSFPVRESGDKDASRAELCGIYKRILKGDFQESLLMGAMKCAYTKKRIAFSGLKDHFFKLLEEEDPRMVKAFNSFLLPPELATSENIEEESKRHLEASLLSLQRVGQKSGSIFGHVKAGKEETDVRIQHYPPSPPVERLPERSFPFRGLLGGMYEEFDIGRGSSVCKLCAKADREREKILVKCDDMRAHFERHFDEETVGWARFTYDEDTKKMMCAQVDGFVQYFKKWNEKHGKAE